MKRIKVQPRTNWREKVEEQGLSYATVDGRLYWDESAAYEFTAAEVDRLEAAANELHGMCLYAAEMVIKNKWYARLAIPEAVVPLIERSWEADEPSLYGRFDLAYNGQGDPKLLEYNADTPTSLVEAAVVQWYWLEDVFPKEDQFNSIHERLVEAWKRYAERTKTKRIHLSALRESLEDNQTILYLEDTLKSAKIEAARLAMEDVGWNGTQFLDLEERAISDLFKLYPWEWLLAEDFGRHVARAGTGFIEPAWKILLSNKGILPILWELYPAHPNLLPAFIEVNPVLGANYVRKPLLSREGNNVRRIKSGITEAESEGPYGEEGFVYQALVDLGDFDGNHPTIGAWIVNHESAGMGIREDRAWISSNNSRFVPHYFR